jgi:two-component system OmpR family sensor kinase
VARRPPAVFDRLAAWSGNIPLRTKITGVTVLILTLGLLVSGIGTTMQLGHHHSKRSDYRARGRNHRFQ